MYKNAAEVLSDYYSGSINYLSIKHEPLKWQITGEALIYIKKFIEQSLKKEKTKYLQYNKKSIKY